MPTGTTRVRVQHTERLVPPALPENAVHVWPVALDSPSWDTSELEQSLSPDELKRARRFHFPRDQQRFTVSRACLRIVLGSYLGQAPREISFSYSETGKPFLSGHLAQSGLCFNVSHSDTLALLGVVRGREIGVDIERIRYDIEFEAIARRFFSATEFSTFNQLPAALKPIAFFQCWTRKEAFVKAVGQGLGYPLDEFDVSFAPGEDARLLGTRRDTAEASRWSFSVPATPSDYIAAVAVKAPQGIVSCWTGETLC